MELDGRLDAPQLEVHFLRAARNSEKGPKRGVPGVAGSRRGYRFLRASGVIPRAPTANRNSVYK